MVIGVRIGELILLCLKSNNPGEAMEPSAKIDAKTMNSFLVILMIGFSIVITYLAFTRDITHHAKDRSKKVDVTRPTQRMVKSLMNEDDAKEMKEFRVSPKKVFNGTWKSFDLDWDLMIVFPDGDSVKVLDIARQDLRTYDRGEYMKHLDKRMNVVSFTNGTRTGICTILKEMLSGDDGNRDSPVAYGCCIIPGFNGFKLMWRGRSAGFNCEWEDIRENVYLSPADIPPGRELSSSSSESEEETE